MKRQNRKHRHYYGRYYATSKDMLEVWNSGQWFIELNPNVGVFRINSTNKRGVPTHLMGYNPHFEALKHQIEKEVARGKQK